MINKIKEFVGIFMKPKQTTQKKPETRTKTTPIAEKASIKREYHQVKVVKEEVREDISWKLPLEKGDVIELLDGKQYKVCKTSTKGIINVVSVSLTRVNKVSSDEEKDEIEDIKFGSLRELNYYISYQKDSIRSVNKENFISSEREMTVDECHLMAIKENQRRDKVERFFNKLEKKQNQNIF